MKKLFTSTLLLLSISSVLFTACSNKESVQSKINEKEFKCEQDGVLAPKWTCNPNFVGSIAAVGIAKMNAGYDKSMQRSEAMADARDTLALQISTKVANLFKSYKGTTGSGTYATYDASTSKVSKQLANETLKGSRAVKSWKNPATDELYLLVVVSKQPIKNNMKKAIITSYQNDQAMYQNFLASHASGELDLELENLNMK